MIPTSDEDRIGLDEVAFLTAKNTGSIYKLLLLLYRRGELTKEEFIEIFDGELSKEELDELKEIVGG